MILYRKRPCGSNSGLAAELLDLFEATGEIGYLAEAEAIFENDEPDLRRVPMIRYCFGAYDRLDDAMALLRCRDLVRITGVKTLEKVLRNVAERLPKDQQEQTKSLMRAAWKLDAKEGITKLERLAKWLEREHPDAAESLREGMEEC